jgi:competence protein ComFC
MGWLDVLHGLFAASAECCPVCGKDKRRPPDAFFPVRHAAPRQALQALCADCLGRIPWIVSTACPICGRPERCGDCLRRRNRHFARCRGAVRYDEAMKEWLALYKYRGLEKLEPVMASMLAAAVEPLLRTAGGFDWVTAVPLAEGRLEERGFNQAERLALRIAKWYRLPYRSLLRRVRNTEKQSRKGRRDRLEDMKGNFVVSSEQGPPGGSPPFPSRSDRSAPTAILLVDDIYTTGSTVNECAFALRQAFPGCEVYGALWARS